MIVVAFGLQIAGLFLTLVGSGLLLKGLFITDEEIEGLTTLPISSSQHTFEKDTPVAVTDPERLKNYRDLFLNKRKEERRKGRTALWLFIVGFKLQLVGLFFATLPDLCGKKGHNT